MWETLIYINSQKSVRLFKGIRTIEVGRKMFQSKSYLGNLFKDPGMPARARRSAKIGASATAGMPARAGTPAPAGSLAITGTPAREEKKQQQQGC